MTKTVRGAIFAWTVILGYTGLAFFCGAVYQKYTVPFNGLVEAGGCVQHGGVNESIGVGRNVAREALGVICEDGESFKVVVN